MLPSGSGAALTDCSGHYDLLYMAQDLPPSSMAAPVETYLQYASHPNQDPVYELGVSDFMTMIPGMSYANPQQGWMSVSNGYTGSDFLTTSTPVPQCTQPLATPDTSVQPQMQSQAMYTATPAQLVPRPMQLPQELAVRSVPSACAQNLSTFQHEATGGPFRPSHWQLQPHFAEATSAAQFQTAIFRK